MQSLFRPIQTCSVWWDLDVKETKLPSKTKLGVSQLGVKQQEVTVENDHQVVDDTDKKLRIVRFFGVTMV